MFCPTYSIIAVVLLQSVLAVPLPLDAKIGDGQYKHVIQETMPLVNQKIKNMKAVINLPDAQAKSHPATVRAFGNNANVQAIRNNLNVLDESKIMIAHTDNEPGLTGGGTWPNGHIRFGAPFYKSDENYRAGTIIHEATHAKLGTVDHFKANGQPGRVGDPYVGYIDSHMPHLNAHHSDQMHHNADAYRKFSDECPNVYRRAMAESHPVVRSVLLRRAAKACTWKPKAKAATGKEASKLGGSSKSTGSQKSISAKKPLNAAKSTSKSAASARASNKKTLSSASAKNVNNPRKPNKLPNTKLASKGPTTPVHHSSKAAASKAKTKGAKPAANPAKHSTKKPAVSTPKGKVSNASTKSNQHSAKRPVAKAPNAKPPTSPAKPAQRSTHNAAVKASKSHTVKAPARPVQHSSKRPTAVAPKAQPAKAAAKVPAPVKAAPKGKKN